MSRSARALHRYRYADYLALEEDSPVKHEYLGGEIYAMAGGTPEHAALAMAVATALGPQLVGSDCRLFSSDLRVRVLATGLTTYPDLTVVCGPIERDAENANTVVNPTLLVEITSPSTEDYDRAEKLEHYKQIPSLRVCLLISHREALMDVWTRDGQGWMHERVARGEQTVLPVASVKLNVDSVYAGALDGL